MIRSGATTAADHHQSTSSIYFATHAATDTNDHRHRRRSTISDVNDADSLRSERLNRRTVKVNHFLLPAFFVECAILACLAVFAYYLRFTSTFMGHRRLIPCSVDLAYPYYGSDGGSGSDTVLVYVDRKMLYCVSFLLPVTLILLSEIIFWLFSSSADRKAVSTIAKSFRIPLVVRRIVRFIGTFWMGALIVSIVTDSMKLLSGRPRPYFLSVCNVTSSACSLDQFVTVNDCHASADEVLREATHSFPSYSAALSSFAAVFCICYTQVMANVHGNYFLRPLLFGILTGMSLLAGYSRWNVYANHWDDLLVGYFMGSTFAIYISFGILHCFRENHAVKTVLTQTPQEPHPWFTWFALPRISTQKTKASTAGHRLSPPPSLQQQPPPPMNAYINGNASDTNSTTIGAPNPAFQNEIHRRLEDFSRKNVNSGPNDRHY